MSLSQLSAYLALRTSLEQSVQKQSKQLVAKQVAEEKTRKAEFQAQAEPARKTRKLGAWKAFLSVNATSAEARPSPSFNCEGMAALSATYQALPAEEKAAYAELSKTMAETRATQKPKKKLKAELIARQHALACIQNPVAGVAAIDKRSALESECRSLQKHASLQQKENSTSVLNVALYCLYVDFIYLSLRSSDIGWGWHIEDRSSEQVGNVPPLRLDLASTCKPFGDLGTISDFGFCPLEDAQQQVMLVQRLQELSVNECVRGIEGVLTIEGAAWEARPTMTSVA
eukprot:3228086-Amphidinium_carterae.1